MRQEKQARARFNTEPRATATAEDALIEASAVVRQRRAFYGPPEEHFARTIGMINALFAHKLKQPFTVEDWPQIMLCDKMARHQEKPQEDNPRDAMGYASCWMECLKRDA
jgi:hypothetical protein